MLPLNQIFWLQEPLYGASQETNPVRKLQTSTQPFKTWKDRKDQEGQEVPGNVASGASSTSGIQSRKRQITSVTKAAKAHQLSRSIRLLFRSCTTYLCEPREAAVYRNVSLVNKNHQKRLRHLRIAASSCLRYQEDLRLQVR